MNLSKETMISVIICSRKADIPQELKDNIAATIGCEYEICVIDNSRNEYNIFTAYNEGVRRAKGDILCFAHDDVVKYHTQNWGRNVEKHFADDKELGCIGITGSHFMPNTPAEWYNCHAPSGGCIQTVGGVSENMQNLEHFTKGKTIVEAVLVDGLWFCIRKSLFDMIRFDAETFDGWHCYDTDICLQVINAGYKVGIVSDVLIEHTSFGTWNTQWVEATKTVYEKWKHILPIVAGMKMTDEEIAWRTKYIETEMSYAFSLVKAETELKAVRKSHAYRIGRIFASPMRMLRNFGRGGVFAGRKR